ncbi:DUF169 domain-containing protein [Methanospirillum sp.]|uniref:DUF169 domain-containing protein n=1 Tax=Methanospirillum sp. TaxID=45200 RepID=UPI0035A073CB
MDVKLQQDFLSCWNKYFPGEPLPVTFEFSSVLRNAQKVPSPKGWRCFVCDLTRVRNGTVLAFDADSISCNGGKRYCGFETELFQDSRYFLSYGIEGKLEGERYKKTPELVDEWQKNLRIVPAAGRYLVFKRWDLLDEYDNPEVVIFFARGETLSGLFTLANYDRSDPLGVIMPMGSGCSSIVYYPWHEGQGDDPKAVIGMMDPSARPCVPLDTITFAVPMKKFSKMVRDMNESFLTTHTWKKVIQKIFMSQQKNK